MQQEINELIKKLIALIELQIQPISLYNENSNLTNLNGLGVYLKNISKGIIKNSVMTT